jgi:hypothetical protein
MQSHLLFVPACTNRGESFQSKAGLVAALFRFDAPFAGDELRGTS